MTPIDRSLRLSPMILTLFLSLTSNLPAADQPDAAAFAASLAAAKAAQKKADSVGGEWRDIGEFLQKAEELAKKNQWSEAIQLTEKARKHSELGYVQALDQKNADFPAYMKP